MDRKYTITKKGWKGLEPTKIPTALEIAWAAGIYEGEGSCIGGGWKGRGFHADISQKDPELLYRLRDMFGGSINLYNVGNERRFTCYHWKVCGDRARLFFALIYPYLTERRKRQIQSTTVWEFLSTIQPMLSACMIDSRDERMESIQAAIGEYNQTSKKAAAEHTLARHREFDRKRYNNPERREQMRQASKVSKKRKREKEKLERIADTSILV